MGESIFTVPSGHVVVKPSVQQSSAAALATDAARIAIDVKNFMVVVRKIW
jgi:hypothetical protein